MRLFKEIESSLVQMEKLLSQEQREMILFCPYEDLLRFHFGLGSWMRSRFLQEEGRLYRLLARGGIRQKDEMSLLLIQLLYLYLKINEK